MDFEQIRQLFRDNPRMWGAVAVAIIALVAVVWWAWGGSVQIGQFFAADVAVPTANISVSPSSTTSGSQVTITWSSTNATSCTTTAGTFSTGGAPNGSATDIISATFTGTAQFRVRCSGPEGSVDSNIASVTVTAPSGSGTTTPAPTNSSQNCVFEVRFNAPEGGWFCEDLQCKLDGNAGKPPSGPATNLSVRIFREIVLPPDGDDALHIRTVLDATPKCSGGGECYPPQDPVWTCEGPMYQGRDGSDLYDCYNPIIHRTDYGPIECCANTGLPGDCFTWDYTGAGGSPLPTSSAGPSVSVSPLQCAPSVQTVNIGEPARVQATGGTSVFTWTTNGGGVQDDGGADFIVYSYATAGSKVITVKSGGLTSFCTVVVGSGSPAPTDTMAPGTGAIVGVKQGRNVTQGQTDFFSNISASAYQTIQFRIQIQSTLAQPSSVIVRDTLPDGTSYKPGTTMINDSPVGDGIANSGIPVSLTPGQEVVIKWGAVADRTDFLDSGDHLLYPRTDIIAPSGVTSADMLVNITGTGEYIGGTGTGGMSTGGGAGGISTGPGDAVILALIGSAIITLLYTAYTRSPSFRRKEIEHIAHDRDPLDFRG